MPTSAVTRRVVSILGFVLAAGCDEEAAAPAPPPDCRVEAPTEVVLDGVRFAVEAPASVRYGEFFDLTVAAENRTDSVVTLQSPPGCVALAGLRSTSNGAASVNCPPASAGILPSRTAGSGHFPPVP